MSIFKSSKEQNQTRMESLKPPGHYSVYSSAFSAVPGKAASSWKRIKYRNKHQTKRPHVNTQLGISRHLKPFGLCVLLQVMKIPPFFPDGNMGTERPNVKNQNYVVSWDPCHSVLLMILIETEWFGGSSIVSSRK